MLAMKEELSMLVVSLILLYALRHKGQGLCLAEDLDPDPASMSDFTHMSNPIEFKVCMVAYVHVFAGSESWITVTIQ